MPVSESQSIRPLFALLSLMIASGCMAEAQPASPDAAPPMLNAPARGEWTVVPSLRSSSIDSDAMTPRLQPARQEEAAGWMVAPSAPGPQAYAAPPLRSDAPMLRTAPPVNAALANHAPVNITPANSMPASRPSQEAWNVAPPVSAKPAAGSEQAQSAPAPSAGSAIAMEPHVPSPDSGTIIALP